METVSPILTYAISSSLLDEEALSWFIDDKINRALLAVPVVGRVERVGGVTREVRVEVGPVRLSSLSVTAADVSRALLRNQRQSSGGSTRIRLGKQSVRTVAIVGQAADLAQVALLNGKGVVGPQSQLLMLRDSKRKLSETR